MLKQASTSNSAIAILPFRPVRTAFFSPLLRSSALVQAREPGRENITIIFSQILCCNNVTVRFGCRIFSTSHALLGCAFLRLGREGQHLHSRKYNCQFPSSLETDSSHSGSHVHLAGVSNCTVRTIRWVSPGPVGAYESVYAYWVQPSSLSGWNTTQSSSQHPKTRRLKPKQIRPIAQRRRDFKG